MIQNVLFKKVALSALLMSAIAVPAVTNADSSQQAPNQTAAAKTVPATAMTATIVSSSLADPIELAQKYAPETVEDWKQTLEQYKKTAGNLSGVNIIGKDVATVPATEAKEYQLAAPLIEASGEKGKSLVISKLDERQMRTLEPASAFSTTTMVDKLEAIPSTAVEMNKAEAGTMAVSIREASESEISFIKAQIGLYKAVDSKDAAAIKDSLSKLLVQYKEQIKEIEAAK